MNISQFSYSPDVEHLSCTQFYAVMNKHMGVIMQVFLWTYIFILSEKEAWGFWDMLCFSKWNLFYKVVVPFYKTSS